MLLVELYVDQGGEVAGSRLLFICCVQLWSSRSLGNPRGNILPNPSTREPFSEMTGSKANLLQSLI
jgi:hypothetical protein